VSSGEKRRTITLYSHSIRSALEEKYFTQKVKIFPYKTRIQRAKVCVLLQVYWCANTHSDFHSYLTVFYSPSYFPFIKTVHHAS